MVKKLLKAGADTRFQDRGGQTPIHNALDHVGSSKNCFVEIANLIIDVDGKNEVQDNNGMTPLHFAAENNCVEIVSKLLAAGVSTRIQNRSGWTPLHVALKIMKDDAAEVLIQADNKIDIQDQYGLSPLHLAANRGSPEIVRNLIAAGANVRRQDVGGKTPLHLALSLGFREVSNILVDVDSKNDIQDKSGETPLYLATLNRDIEIVRKLLLGGVQPQAVDILSAYRPESRVVLEMILSSCAWRDITIDWEGCPLDSDEKEWRMTFLSECLAEINCMKAKIPATSVSFHDLAKESVIKVARYLENEMVQKFLHCNNVALLFPHYASLFSDQLGQAEERRVLTAQCWDCFAALSQKWPLLPATTVDNILSCFSAKDMQNFVHAFKVNP
ncbi:ankyrin repeat and protein kinase domain-containing protein 1-like [Uloborus diversus]|uniref:ankyrin repeat and protein kinase domain-containing protein 1-like n=1 Tax=Uloborus diversus TaxID=327109 RepID=UPI00240A5E10|nr:ankyrin repeat and protein kinase domain-containing protein 1-like [Uloborus diversus]